MRRALACTCLAALAAAPAPASADDLYDRLWPRVPDGAQLTLSDQLTDRLTLLGNTLGHHLDLLSQDTLSLRFDGRRRRAFLRLGAGTGEHAVFRLATHIHVVDSLARIQLHLELGVAGRSLSLSLPELEMTPTELHGERGVVLRLPLFRRPF